MKRLPKLFAGNARSPRRGVLLLVVLSLLVLFALIGITFVLVASQARRIARSDNRGEQYTDDYRKQIDDVLGQIVRDTTNPQSVLRTHSLLNDMYGVDGALGDYTSASAPTGSPSTQFIDIKIDPAAPAPAPGRIATLASATPPYLVSPTPPQSWASPGYFNGCVLTMLDGPAKDCSTRIVGWNYNSTTLVCTIRIMAFDGASLASGMASAAISTGGTGPVVLTGGITVTANNQSGYTINANDLVTVTKDASGTSFATALYGKFLINGRPFNGTGFGLPGSTTFVRVGATAIPAGGTGSVTQLMPSSTITGLVSGPPITGAVNQSNGTLPANSVAVAYQNATGWILLSTALGAADGKGNPYALMPNPRYFTEGFDPNYLTFGGNGGADEDYDAVDLQNMLLASIVPNASAPGNIVPSLHRPDLIQYWASKSWSSATMGPPVPDPTLPRKVILRPIGPPAPTVTLPGGFDHANFTGSNAGTTGFDPIAGPWDVDNDGDGVADSVWVDVGMKVQTAADGRQYKPMAAIMVLDLDGRLNVNAHGNVVQADSNFAIPIAVGGGASPISLSNYAFAAGGSAVPLMLPRGQGYGPAEINLGLGGIFASPSTDYLKFFQGQANGTKSYEGRYGKYTTTGIVSSPPPLPGSAGASADDILDLVKRFDFPKNFPLLAPTGFNCFGGLSDYGSPSDLWGRSAVALDYAGQPITSFLNSGPSLGTTPADNPLGSALNETPGDPYEINLSHSRTRSTRSSGDPPSTKDNTFATSELERILRRYDLDVSALPERLQAMLGLAPFGANTLDVGRLITTDSYDVPSPSILPTKDMAAIYLANGDPLAGQSLTDLLRMKLYQFQRQAAIAIGTPITAAFLTSLRQSTSLQAAAMLPPEVVAGLRFDLNRPFGNGHDDDANGVVDEPTFAEFTAGSSESPANWTTAFGVAVPLDLNNDGAVVPPNSNPSLTPPNSDIYARQQYAKHLYVMMMLLADQTYQFSQESGVGTAPPPGGVSQQQELLARRIAQWAVNVVDFRDPDSIMTPFEYDVNPFNGWNVDGVLGSGDDTGPERRLVWGCENPDLILTEAMALHDRRVRDTQNDDGAGPLTPAPNDMNGTNPANPKDSDYDQYRVPQGSVFFELYSPRKSNGTQSAYSADVYSGGNVNLAALARADAASGLQYPVWRIAITGTTFLAPGNNDINALFNAHPDTANFDPPGTGTTDSFNTGVFTSARPATIERLVWFTNASPNISPAESNISYYNQLGPAPLLTPGQYALVGPRPLTTLGRTTGDTLPTPAAPQAQIQLSPTVAIYNSAGQNIYTTNSIVPPLGIICVGTSPLPATVPPWSNTLAPNGIGMSVTEPLFSDPNYYPAPATADPDLKYLKPLDTPLDDRTTTPLGNDKQTRPTLLQTGTQQNYKTALLQRLANPLAAYDPVTNPYLTVSWQPIDLTVFNGDALQQSKSNPVPDPDDPLNFTPISPLPLGDRQMGPVSSPVASLAGAPATLSPVGRGTNNLVFDYDIPNTLGFLNSAWGTPWKNPPATLSGYQGVPDPTSSTYTFPWVTWNNRPFVSNMELLLVPATSAEQLVRQFTSAPQTSATSPYSPVPGTFQFPCGHLLNFLLSSDGSASDGLGVGAGAPNFFRLLDYVHVPSRFVGTDTYLNPANFAAPLPSVSGLLESDLVSFYHPPFNKVSTYREPGRVNVNTIPADVVWNAILNNGPGPSWPQVAASRANVSLVGPNSTAIANPFRSAGGSFYGLPGTPPITSEINVTLLRPLTLDPTTFIATAPFVPLFNALPLIAVPALNSDRNPYFRYQPLTRMSNMLTTRSNVYAIWITIGYFEVTPATGAAYPDGYQLGQEMGSDTGDIKRHRAFYIYDRSIPVGFEPGKDHNYDKGILVKRFIE